MSTVILTCSFNRQASNSDIHTKITVLVISTGIFFTWFAFPTLLNFPHRSAFGEICNREKKSLTWQKIKVSLVAVQWKQTFEYSVFFNRKVYGIFWLSCSHAYHVKTNLSTYDKRCNASTMRGHKIKRQIEQCANYHLLFGCFSL